MKRLLIIHPATKEDHEAIVEYLESFWGALDWHIHEDEEKNPIWDGSQITVKVEDEGLLNDLKDQKFEFDWDYQDIKPLTKNKWGRNNTLIPDEEWESMMMDAIENGTMGMVAKYQLMGKGFVSFPVDLKAKELMQALVNAEKALEDYLEIKKFDWGKYS